MRVIAVDVGTTSVRLAIVNFDGKDESKVQVLVSHNKPIGYHQNGLRFEQNSAEIWQSICDCCRICLRKLEQLADEQHSIQGIAFSATCSLVIQSRNSSNSTNGARKDDITMWLDHRATKEAAAINDSGSKVLTQFGGVCSPEFSLAKLIWFKANETETFDSSDGFFELPDWLVYRCIGSTPENSPRSLCSLVCKWGYDVHGTHCDEIASLFGNQNMKVMESKLGNLVSRPGTVAGYLTEAAARELGFNSGDGSCVVVGTSLIDAHSGMLAMLPLVESKLNSGIDSTLCSLAGTSSCHMLLSKSHRFTRGIWGPYKDVILKDFYLREAGQSMTGKLIEICIESHIEGRSRLDKGETLQEIIIDLNKKLSNPLQTELHILPTYHGNRSPLANPRLRGGVYGLSIQTPGASLIETYVATVEALVYEMKYIFDALRTDLHNIIVSGGLTKNHFFMQTISDVLRAQVASINFGTIDAMVMGSALVARQAVINSTIYPSTNIEPLTEENSRHISYENLDLKVFKPRDMTTSYHQRKYRCYIELVEMSLRIDKIQQEDTGGLITSQTA